MATRQLPLVSLVVATRNEARHLPALLESLAASEYPVERIEVLIVDGESTDGTREVAQGYVSRLPGLRIVPNPQRITPAAFNRGIEASHGDYVGLVSGHSTLSPSYVAETVAAFERLGAEADCIGGVYTNVGEGFWGEVIARLISSPAVVGNAKFRFSQQEQRVDTVTGTYRREVYGRIGLYDERLLRNQDNEFNARLRRAGGTIFLVPRIRMAYQVRGTLRGALTQFFRNGKWTIYTQLLHPYAMSVRHFVPLGFVVGGAGVVALAVALGTPWVAVVPAALYGAVVLRGASGHGFAPRQLAAAVIAQPLLHFAYGIGSLVGIVTSPRFLARSRGYTPPRSGASLGAHADVALTDSSREG